jgi:hypothetical protein
MATLLDAPEFTANEIYAIQQTDPVEGAAASASFSGLGISNQPHQQLANRTAFLKQRQDTNISNIGILQGFAAVFTSNITVTSGWFTLAQNDQSRGAVSLLVQYYVYGNELPSNQTYAFIWPKPFPNLCLGFLPISYNPGAIQGYGQCQVEAVSWSATGAVINVDLIGGSSGSRDGIPGFIALALGF